MNNPIPARFENGTFRPLTIVPENMKKGKVFIFIEPLDENIFFQKNSIEVLKKLTKASEKDDSVVWNEYF